MVERLRRETFAERVGCATIKDAGFKFHEAILPLEWGRAYLAYLPYLRRGITLVVVEGVRQVRGGREWTEWHLGEIGGLPLRDREGVDHDAFLKAVSKIARSRKTRVAGRNLPGLIKDRVRLDKLAGGAVPVPDTLNFFTK